VRFPRLDFTVSQFDEAGAPGKLSDEVRPVLRWAAFERPGAPAVRALPVRFDREVANLMFSVV
jgi:hypothetical protein